MLTRATVSAAKTLANTTSWSVCRSLRRLASVLGVENGPTSRLSSPQARSLRSCGPASEPGCHRLRRSAGRGGAQSSERLGVARGSELEQQAAAHVSARDRVSAGTTIPHGGPDLIRLADTTKRGLVAALRTSVRGLAEHVHSGRGVLRGWRLPPERIHLEQQLQVRPAHRTAHAEEVRAGGACMMHSSKRTRVFSPGGSSTAELSPRVAPSMLREEMKDLPLMEAAVRQRRETL
eukprot:3850592-Rhodomonas_salina.2